MIEQSKTIQSVDRALKILELYSGNILELSVTEIANELQLNKSTAFGLIKTLVGRGYLQQNANNFKYFLGLKLFELGNNVEITNVLRQLMHPYLDTMAVKFNEAANLAIEDNGEIVHIDRALGANVVILNTAIGVREPMYCTGLGKCLLAFMDEDKKERIIGQINFKARTKNTIVNIEDLRRELEIIYKRGYSIDNEEYELGLVCIAAPVINKQKGIYASISISAPTSRINYDHIENTANYLKDVVKRISSIV